MYPAQKEEESRRVHGIPEQEVGIGQGEIRAGEKGEGSASGTREEGTRSAHGARQDDANANERYHAEEVSLLCRTMRTSCSFFSSFR